VYSLTKLTKTGLYPTNPMGVTIELNSLQNGRKKAFLQNQKPFCKAFCKALILYITYTYFKSLQMSLSQNLPVRG
jgi:hypothetical protein